MRYFILLLSFFVVDPALTQGFSMLDSIKIPANYKPAFNRQRNHEAIDAEQQKILASDGTPDNWFSPTQNEEVNFLVTRAITKKADEIQYIIESDKILDHRLKVNYLFGLESLLKHLRTHWKQKSDKKVSPAFFPAIIQSYEECMNLDRQGLSIAPVIERLTYEEGTAVLKAGIFEKNPGYSGANNNMILKFCLRYPEKTLAKLSENPDVPFADSLIRLVARKYSKQLYDYSQANNKLGTIIRNIDDDPFIQTIVRMARSKDGQQYFCFLDNILKGKISFEEIDEAKGDSVKYFKLLVKTRMDYVARMLDKDTAYETETLTRRMERKAQEDFVNTINGLHHERNPDIRFRCIQPLSAQELYYLAVSSDGIIYTSSFIKGIYPLMMKKINYRGDSLLLSLNFDRYRKFIKMAAGFNTLGNFLSTFPPTKNPNEESDAVKLMKAFVSRLETGNGLEDGVDVADSYASIFETLKPVADEMLKNVQLNYKRNEAAGNKRGMVIYNILTKLFLSADSANQIDLTKELGIPPVYEVPYSSLTYDKDKVAVQLFIYGDKDGMGVFPSLIKMFHNPNWKIDGSNKQWVTITSAKGKPVTLYMNRPLPEETNEDALAQKALCQYLEKNNIKPTVTINRGHSYNALYTIEQMSSASKIVFMGSCGGYRMIHDILEKAPDAHIIGTKQIADAPVNNPFLRLIMEKLRTGSNIKWIPFWKELAKMTNDPIFADYVPPHKNLGALFIKAYMKAMEDE